MSSPPSPSVAVFCGSTTPPFPIYAKDAALLGEHLAAASFSVLYGGGDQGLMGILAHHVLDLGGSVAAVTTTQELEGDQILPLEDVMLVESNTARKHLFFQEAAAFIVLPGGWGTLDELAFLILEKKISKMKKPLVLLNTGGFWDHFLTLMVKMGEEGFITEADKALFALANTPQEAVDYASQGLA